MTTAREVLGKFYEVHREWEDPETGNKWLHVEMESATSLEAHQTEEYSRAPRLLWYKGELYGWISWNSDRLTMAYSTKNAEKYAIPATYPEVR